MRIVVFEEDRGRQQRMLRVIREAEPDADIMAFEQSVQLLEYANRYHPQAAFISVEQSDGKGLFLVKKLSRLSPKTNVIAMAREYRFAKELMNLRISGYIVEELTKDLVAEEMNNLRYTENAYG